MFDWKWDFTFEILPRLLAGALNTLMAAGSGYVIALIVGLVFALAQRTPYYVLTKVVRETVEFIRSTPLLVQIFFIFYVGPQFGILLSPWTSGLIALGLHYAAFLSEVYRAGLDSVPKGQWEACRALNLSASRTYFRIIIPQAVPPSLPAMGNYLIGIFKDSAMLAVIAVAELLHTATAIGAETYRFLEPYTLVGLIFLSIAVPSAFGLRRVEAWVQKRSGATR